MHPSSIVAVLKNVTCNCQCLKLQNFGQGCYKPGGGGASAPLAPPLNPPLTSPEALAIVHVRHWIGAFMDTTRNLATIIQVVG